MPDDTRFSFNVFDYLVDDTLDEVACRIIDYNQGIIDRIQGNVEGPREPQAPEWTDNVPPDLTDGFDFLL